MLAPLGSAQAEPVNGLIVQLRSNSNSTTRETPQAVRERVAAVTQQATGLGVQAQRRITGEHHLVRLEQSLDGSALQKAMQSLRTQPDVLSVEPNVRIPRLAIPDDPGFAQQWHLQVPSSYAAAINMPPAWDISTGTNTVVVAVLDTGILKTHPDLNASTNAQILPGYDLVSEVVYANDGDGRDADPSDPGDWVSAAETQTSAFASCSAENSTWHGSFVAGEIAALTNNALGIAGVNWRAQLLPVRIAGKCGAQLSDLLDGIRWAAGLSVEGVPDNTHPARIINLSFGGDAPCSSSYQAAVNEATAAGSLLVVAAGNSGSTPKRPADCAHVLAVGAVRADGAKTSYSSLGTAIGLMAPGGASSTNLPIYSLSNDGTQGPTVDSYGNKFGTSFSAPLASGVASLMLGINPALTPAQLIERIQAGARAFPSVSQLSSCRLPSSGECNCSTSTCGAGLLDAAGALAQAQKPIVTLVPLDNPAPGSQITLDGSASSAIPGARLVSYTWTQTAGSAAVLRTANTAVASATLPKSAGPWSFQLQVQDDAGHTNTAVLSTGDASSDSSGAAGWLWGLALWVLALWQCSQRRLRQRQCG